MDLDFKKAEFSDGSTPPQPAECAVCKQPLEGAYYLVGGSPACERCKTQHEYEQTSISGSSRFLRAALFGLGAALAGSALWYGVRVITGWEVGLVAVVVGLMVGGAVRAGSRHRGGLLYQLLAVALTYFGICAQYVPDIVKAIRNAPPEAQGNAAPVTTVPTPDPDSRPAPTLAGALLGVGLLLALALAAPFLGGFQNIIGILIIGFALWEAWKMNKRVLIEVEGPFRLGTEAR